VTTALLVLVAIVLALYGPAVVRRSRRYWKTRQWQRRRDGAISNR
jgi:hypothetical protein